MDNRTIGLLGFTLALGAGLGAGGMHLANRPGATPDSGAQTIAPAPVASRPETAPQLPEAAPEAAPIPAPDVPAPPAPVAETVSPVEPAPPAPPSPPPTTDADRARAAVQRGEMLPLKEILAKIATRFPGEVIDVELSEDDGVLEYEIKIQTARGRVVELEVDPRTGAILDVDEDDD
ncbi:PepSY domain-containing protein [Terrihabitans sp. B22-R8]|uniref:PepSY domain-containing protein n=1 Tax=Terrihabitans sp. B22-R8 TaxID=3425128 RepID=UPI00403C6560